MQRDGTLPVIPKKRTSTYIRREFGGGSFEIPITDQQYNDSFKPKPMRIDNYETYEIRPNPSEYYLCYRDEEGNEVKIRNTPRTL